MAVEDTLAHPELEASLHAQPDDLETWLVYGDWLQAQDDPRGQLVALQVAIEQASEQADKREKLEAQYNELVSKYQTSWLRPELIELTHDDDGALPNLELEWRFGFLWGFCSRLSYEREEPSVAEVLKEILASPASRFVHEVRIGLTDAESDASYLEEVGIVAEGGPRPSIRRVYVGCFEFPDESEISWSSVGSVESLYIACPNLNWLKVQGGDIELGELRHPQLETLTIHTGGLPSEAAMSISKAQLPKLKTMEVWFGSQNYGGSTEPNMLESLLDAQGVPKLQNLGLMNAEFTDALPELLSGSKVLSQLNTLDLSMGTMSDEGCESLLRHRESFKHLKRLDVDDNTLSEEAVNKLRAEFGDVLYSKHQKRYESDYRYPSVGE